MFSRGNFSCGVENRYRVSTTHKYGHGQAVTALRMGHETTRYEQGEWP